MEHYEAPFEDIYFALTKIANIDNYVKETGNTEISSDDIKMLLEQAGKFAKEELATINQKGDLEGVKLENGVVRMPKYFISAYKSFINSGWFSVVGEKEFGGQNLPWAAIVGINEIWESANMSFAVNNMLTQGAIECIQEHGSISQKKHFLPNLISGKWSGTMNLTEPHAGSDLSQLKTKAIKSGKQFKIVGTKIYITHGDQDMTENIVHLVLARLPDAPKGVKGISLFLVPKYYENLEGRTKKNDIKVLSIEHKLGHNASPTCVLSFGEEEGAYGELVGEENQGLKAMFTMMNNARLNVGVQGVAISERAYQKAIHFARERKQGNSLDNQHVQDITIINHPDVKRMLMEMRSQIEAMRALTILTGEMIDYYKSFSDSKKGKEYLYLTNLLTPVVKGWCTDQSVNITSLGIQIHGGMGFIEDTGAAQYFRDSRILPIYEGTNGIQAIDLIKRKLNQENGQTFKRLLNMIEETSNLCEQSDRLDIKNIGNSLKIAKKNLEETGVWLIENLDKDILKAASGATPFLNMFGWVLGGWVMAKSALQAFRLIENNTNVTFAKNKINTAIFYSDTYLPIASSLKSTIMKSHNSIRFVV